MKGDIEYRIDGLRNKLEHTVDKYYENDYKRVLALSRKFDKLIVRYITITSKTELQKDIHIKRMEEV